MSNYTRAFLFGAAAGPVIKIATSGAGLLPTMGAGAASGTGGELLAQAVDIGLGYAHNLDPRAIAANGIIGAVASHIPVLRMEGVTAGRYNPISIYNGVITRRTNGHIRNISPAVSARAAAASELGSAPSQIYELGASLAWEYRNR